MDEFNETIEIFRGDLGMSVNLEKYVRLRSGTYSIVLLIKIVHIAVKYLNKELNRYSRVHACICNTKSTLKTLKNPLAISIQLYVLANPRKCAYCNLHLSRLLPRLSQ